MEANGEDRTSPMKELKLKLNPVRAHRSQYFWDRKPPFLRKSKQETKHTIEVS